MVHTLPPWTSKWRMATIFGQIDQGELAARLGSINTFDRRGDTVWIDDFEASILKWYLTNHIGTGSASLISQYSRSGSQAVKITSGPNENNQTSITRLFPLPVTSRLGFEFHFTSPDDNAELMLQVLVYTGARKYIWHLAYDHSTESLNIMESPGEPKDIADLALPHSNYLWHSLKLVTDHVGNTYVRAIVNNIEYDLSSEGAAWEIDTATDPHVNVRIQVWNKDAGAATVYIDDFILTQNE